MRGAIAAEIEGCFDRYVDEVDRHMESDPKKMDDPEVIRAALEASQLPADAILRRRRTLFWKDTLARCRARDREAEQ